MEKTEVARISKEKIMKLTKECEAMLFALKNKEDKILKAYADRLETERTKELKAEIDKK